MLKAHGALIVLRDITEVVDRTEGGIFLPQQAMDRQRHRRWIIDSVGPWVQDPTLQPGLEVITSGRFVGEPVVHEQETYRVVHEENIIAILAEEGE